MTEVCREPRRRTVDIHAGVMPTHEGLHRKGVAQIMGATVRLLGAWPRFDLAQQRAEHLVKRAAVDPLAAGAEEERHCAGLRARLVAHAGVLAKRGGSRLVQRHVSLLLLLGDPQAQHPVVEADVAVHGERLADPDPGRRE